MTTYKTNVQKEMSLQKILCMIFIPTSILTIVYIVIGGLNQTIPSLLLFYICATLVLFPIEIGIVFNVSKKEYGSYSLKSAFTNYKKMSWWKIFLYGSLLFAFAGIMSVTLAPLENTLFVPITNKFTQVALEANVNLILRVPERELWVELDADRIEQVITNLIENAIRHTPDKGSVTVHVEQYGESCKLTVQDTGVGISEEDVEENFVNRKS